MVILKTRNIGKDLKKVRVFSSLIEKKLGQYDKKKEHKIEKLSFEQLNDLNKLTCAADYILSKYEDNKEVYSILKDFVDMIYNSTESMDLLNDKISEMVVSAENAISRIKNLQGEVSNNFSIISSNKGDENQESDITTETSTNNLTKSATAVYT